MCQVTDENIKALQNLREELHQMNAEVNTIVARFYKAVTIGGFSLVIALLAGLWNIDSKFTAFESALAQHKEEQAKAVSRIKSDQAGNAPARELIKQQIASRNAQCAANHEAEERRWQSMENRMLSLETRHDKFREAFGNFREEVARRK